MPEGSTARGYDRRWRKLRSWQLRRRPLCQHCEQNGRIRQATEVDHIKPFRDRFDPLRLDPENLQSLCNPCHERKTHQTKPKHGAGADGWPTDPNHWWNR